MLHYMLFNSTIIVAIRPHYLLLFMFDRSTSIQVVGNNVQREIWKKFVMLTPLAGATSYYRCPIGPILADEERRAFHAALVRETAAVAAVKGVALPLDIADKVIGGSGKLPESAKSSMLHDLEGGRRLELPWLNGAVVRLGEELDVETPSHRAVCEALKPFVDGV